MGASSPFGSTLQRPSPAQTDQAGKIHSIFWYDAELHEIEDGRISIWPRLGHTDARSRTHTRTSSPKGGKHGDGCRAARDVGGKNARHVDRLSGSPAGCAGLSLPTYLPTCPRNDQCGREGLARQMKLTARPMIFNNPLTREAYRPEMV
ncbi:hypothetical protein LY76DRAFT_288772 [Colletotrichum caudatum]|nr:hypothetical protein LY76DRAFT_288772 [Colletotrichum caudatum]